MLYANSQGTNVKCLLSVYFYENCIQIDRSIYFSASALLYHCNIVITACLALYLCMPMFYNADSAVLRFSAIMFYLQNLKKRMDSKS